MAVSTFMWVFLLVVSACFAAPCDDENCGPSGTYETACSFTCNCSAPADFARTYNCTSLTGLAGFYWTEYNFTTNSVYVDLTYQNQTGTFTVVKGVDTSSTTVRRVLPEVYSGTFSSFNVINASDVFFKAVTIPCKPAVIVSEQDISFSWTIDGVADKLVTFAVATGDSPVGNQTDNKYSVPPACGATGLYTVSSSLIGRQCLQSAGVSLALSTPPSAPTTLTAFNVSGNASGLNVSLVWDVPVDLGHCTVNTFTYAVVISTPLAVVLNTTLTAAEVVTQNTSIATNAALVLSNASLDVNEVYTVALTVLSPAGAAPVVTTTFTLPNSAPADDTSGLSNTIIAGIAVGATVAVVALALIVYKCSAPARDYSSIA